MTKMIFDTEHREKEMYERLHAAHRQFHSSCPELDDEARRVSLRQQAISEAASLVLDAAWTLAAMEDCIVSLEHRLVQVGQLIEKMKAGTQKLHSNIVGGDPPKDIFTLSDWLAVYPEEIKKGQQIAAVSGATAALALVKACNPDAKIDKMAKGAPLDADGNKVDVTALMPSVLEPAKQIAELMDLSGHRVGR